MDLIYFFIMNFFFKVNALIKKITIIFTNKFNQLQIKVCASIF